MMTPTMSVNAEDCPTYDFQNLFFEDFFPSKWDNSSRKRIISWSLFAGVIGGEKVARPFSFIESDWIRSAFQSWDNEIETIEFLETSTSADAEVVIGWVNDLGGLGGQWSTPAKNGFRFSGFIKLSASIHYLSWFSQRNQFIHAVQHELGNVLGLGDIKPSDLFDSVQEDDWRMPYGNIPLSNFDIGMIRQLYDESTCPSSYPSSVKAAAELKVRQEAEAKAEAEAAAKASMTKKKSSLICVKGSTVKKVIGKNRKCPSGFKIRK